jgi:hypothetical protein
VEKWGEYKMEKNKDILHRMMHSFPTSFHLPHFLLPWRFNHAKHSVDVALTQITPNTQELKKPRELLIGSRSQQEIGSRCGMQSWKCRVIRHLDAHLFESPGNKSKVGLMRMETTPRLRKPTA